MCRIIRLGGTSRGAFNQSVREAVAGDKLTSQLMDAMLSARAALWKEYCRLHNLVVKFVARNELCRRFMAIPGCQEPSWRDNSVLVKSIS